MLSIRASSRLAASALRPSAQKMAMASSSAPKDSLASSSAPNTAMARPSSGTGQLSPVASGISLAEEGRKAVVMRKRRNAMVRFARVFSGSLSCLGLISSPLRALGGGGGVSQTVDEQPINQTVPHRFMGPVWISEGEPCDVRRKKRRRRFHCRLLRVGEGGGGRTDACSGEGARHGTAEWYDGAVV